MDSRTGYGRLGMLAIVAATLLLALSTPAQADPPILTSVSGTCDPGVGTSGFTTTPVSGTHDDLDWRVSTDGGPGSWQGVTAWNGAASTFWGTGVSLPNGSASNGTVHCETASSPFNYEIDWYDRPTPPVSFSGSLANAQTSDLGVQIPETGGYLLSGTPMGSLSLFDGSEFVSFPADGLDTIDDAGPADFEVRNDGGASAFTLGVGGEETPTIFSDGFNRTSTSVPATPVDLGYQLNVPAHVKITLMSPDGTTPVRTLLDSWEEGDFSIVWDLRDELGNLVGEGFHYIDVTASNSVGSSTIYDRVLRDTQGPTIAIRPPLFAQLALTLAITDPSGLRSSTVMIDGVNVPYLHGVLRKILGAGNHTVSVVATDRLGHSSSATRTFTLVPRPPPLRPHSCDATQAKLLVRGATSVAGRLRRLARLGGRDVFKGFSVRQVVCGRITGQFPSDMAILLKARHGKRTPLVFAEGDGTTGWNAAYTSTKPRISSISVRANRLVERRRLRGGKSKLVSLSWNGIALVQVPK